MYNGYFDTGTILIWWTRLSPHGWKTLFEELFLKSSSNKDSFPSIWKVENSHNK